MTVYANDGFILNFSLKVMTERFIHELIRVATVYYSYYRSTH